MRRPAGFRKAASTVREGLLLLLRFNRRHLEHPARTALAATAALLVARLFRLPEAYWAAITTLIVMQSSLGQALTISSGRFIGTALGAILGGLLGSYFTPNILVFAAAVFIAGVICAPLRLERNAYRYASVTLAIVLLVASDKPAWVVAVHRFFEVSIGIAVGLIVTALWPESSIQ